MAVNQAVSEGLRQRKSHSYVPPLARSSLDCGACDKKASGSPLRFPCNQMFWYCSMHRVGLEPVHGKCRLDF